MTPQLVEYQVIVPLMPPVPRVALNEVEDPAAIVVLALTVLIVLSAAIAIVEDVIGEPFPQALEGVTVIVPPVVPHVTVLLAVVVLAEPVTPVGNVHK